jgi:phenylacetic acid degradation operon negative regulatory protein
MDADRTRVPRQYAAEGLRPQALLFTLLGRHIAPLDRPVASSTFLDVLSRLGVSVQAGRSTLKRMVWRGHLERHRVGRRAYFSISDKLRKVLQEGRRRIFEPPVRDVPDDVWTLLSFSIPEGQRADRHSLRTALAWNGFGLLRNGLWIAPGDVDVSDIVAKFDLQDRVEVFSARPSGPTDLQRVVNEAWDLRAIEGQYREFIETWSGPLPSVEDGHLAPQIRLIPHWQQLLVDDPELPPRYLPDDWPAMGAFDPFLRTDATLSPPGTYGVHRGVGHPRPRAGGVTFVVSVTGSRPARPSAPPRPR